jgi:hypothetical protein
MVTDEQKETYDNLMNPAGFGIFSDEGMVAGPFYTRQNATDAMVAEDPNGESGLYVAGVCPDHEDHQASCCEICAEEESEEASE